VNVLGLRPPVCLGAHIDVSSLEFPQKFLKLFQAAGGFAFLAGDAYHARGNTEHVRQTGREAL